MANTQDSLVWSSQLRVVPPSRTPRLPGDKVILPQSALEQLLAAAPVRQVASSSSSSPPQPRSRPYTHNFDPFNPYTFAAEARAREHEQMMHAEVSRQQQQLPHPLTFRIVNPKNGRKVYAGIREFSAEGDDEIGLSPFLRDALRIEPEQLSDELETRRGGAGNEAGAATAAIDDESVASVPVAAAETTFVVVHAEQLPKGTYARLRPLEAGYDPGDWKALLERHLRENFTTLTAGEVLSVPGVRPGETFRFLVDKVEPQGDGICVVDTDLEVDIEPLNEDQARETLKRKTQLNSSRGQSGGSSLGGPVIVGRRRGEEETAVRGQVLKGEYVDYELQEWPRNETVAIELEVEDDGDNTDDLDLLVSPFSPHQRNRPRMDEHVLAVISGSSPKRIELQPTNVALEGAESLFISVHSFDTAASATSTGTQDGLQQHAQEPASQRTFQKYVLRIRSGTLKQQQSQPTERDGPEADNDGDVQCKNCHQWVPPRTLMLHENFCLRNNVLCPRCGTVFQKRSAAWENHWHCAHDLSHGNDLASKAKHDAVFHETYACSRCSFEAQGLPALAQHRTSTCPGKPILCQFCHLVVPQQGESDPDVNDPEVLLSGLTPHEVVDGGRTTECHLCSKIVRLRELKTHLRHHDLERLSRPAPRICTNQNCCRTIGGSGSNSFGSGARHDSAPSSTLGLCSICFGPLYVDTYDPEGKALRRRIERRYLSQMLAGCGKPWCLNEHCKTGRANRLGTLPTTTMTAADAMVAIKPLIEAVDLGQQRANTGPFYFCTDQANQQRRTLAEMIAAEGLVSGGRKAYALEWCIAAVEATGGDMDKAREWLNKWAPAKGETVAT